MTIIAQITDLHLRPRGVACYRVSDTNMFAERAIRALMTLETRPDAVVVTGDLTDRDDPREYAVARTLLGKLPMPVYLLPGNHDSSAGMRAAMSDYPGLSETTDGKIRYGADIGALRLLVLDSHVANEPHGRLGPDQLAWLDTELAATTRPTLIALHHPPVKTGILHMDRMGLLDADALAEVVSQHDHVARIMCGHVHRPIVSAFAGTIMTLAPSTSHQVVLGLAEDSPSQFNFEPPAYFLHQQVQTGSLVTHTAYVEPFPGPHSFYADEGVAWPGDTPS